MQAHTDGKSKLPHPGVRWVRNEIVAYPKYHDRWRPHLPAKKPAIDDLRYVPTLGLVGHLNDAVLRRETRGTPEYLSPASPKVRCVAEHLAQPRATDLCPTAAASPQITRGAVVSLQAPRGRRGRPGVVRRRRAHRGPRSIAHLVSPRRGSERGTCSVGRGARVARLLRRGGACGERDSSRKKKGRDELQRWHDARPPAHRPTDWFPAAVVVANAPFR